jgi:outer membrane lipoprotein LolB
VTACSLTPQNARVRRGKFSLFVKTPQDQRNEQGRYELTEFAGNTQLDLITPLGGVLARVTLTEQGAVLEYSDKRSEARSAEELMQRELGFALPLSMLSSWLDGIPDPSFPFSRQSEDSFEQRDWGISIRRRNAAGEPQLISASSPMPAGGLLRITLTAEAR